MSKKTGRVTKGRLDGLKGARKASPRNRTVQIGNGLFVQIADGGSTESVVEVKLK